MKWTTMWMVLLAAVTSAAPVRAEWPLWDGKESVAEYAKRAGIKDVEMNLDLGDGVSMKLTLIPAGRFVMGDRDEQSVVIEGVNVLIQEGGYGPYWARPEREVTISQPFYMGAHEVTQEQYDQVMGPDSARGAKYDENKGYRRGKTYPEGRLSWQEAAEFCLKLSAQTDMQVWLPTEAQWEYACRAGSSTKFPWGESNDEWKTYANYTWIQEGETLATAKSASGFRGMAPVGSFKPNAWGLYDMLGNVDEYCHDWFTGSFLGAATLDPAGPGSPPPEGAATHVWRGGGFASVWGPPQSRGRPLHNGAPLIGFRVVVGLKSATTTAPGPVNLWILGKAGHLLEAPVKAPARGPAAPAGAVDSSLRVPPGCRAAAGTQAEPYTKSGYAQAIVHEASGVEMVYIPAGTFLMGTPADFTPWQAASEKGHLARFERLRRVTLTRGFYIGKHEVTQAQWERVMGYNPSLFKNVGPEAPVDTVSWDECQEFCKKAGGGLRLPTEAEWEYACRAGSKGWYAGDLEDIGWHNGNSGGTTHPVGSKKPNAWGLHDMHGNVREWCQDIAAHEYPPEEPVTDPTGPTEPPYGNPRMIRSGSWADYPFSCRSAARISWGATAVGKASGTSNVWENPQAQVVTMHPTFGCRVVLTAAGPR